MKFSKMHGLGNDFLVFMDDDTGRDWSSMAVKVCPRRLAVGADGILVGVPSEKADIGMRIFNSDGSEAEMCGNGIRCFAKFAYENGIVDKQEMTVETLAGIIRPTLITKDGKVTDVMVDMGQPVFEREAIPMRGGGSGLDADIDVLGESRSASSMLMGVPHTVILTDDLGKVPITKLGPVIETHALFPRNTNVNFVEVTDRKNIQLRTWERGAGLTMACGTGACASVVAMNYKGLVDRKVRVHLAAGSMQIEYMEDGRVMMTGPAVLVYEADLSE